MEHYSSTKSNENGSLVEKLMDLECRTAWRRSETEKQILYINEYMWNLEKWHVWTYLQSRNRDTDVENKYMDTKGDRSGGRSWDTGIDTYTLLMYKIDNYREHIIQQGTLLKALCWSEWEGSPKESSCMNMYGWFIMLYSRK